MLLCSEGARDLQAISKEILRELAASMHSQRSRGLHRSFPASTAWSSSYDEPAGELSQVWPPTTMAEEAAGREQDAHHPARPGEAQDKPVRLQPISRPTGPELAAAAAASSSPSATLAPGEPRTT